MRVLVLGAGMMGGVMAGDLAASEGVSRVVVADRDASLAGGVRDRWDGGRGVIVPVTLDISDRDRVLELMHDSDVVAGAYPERWAAEMTRCAIETRTSLVDMTALIGRESRQAMHDDAERAGITIVPGCGVAPGLSNILMGIGTEMVPDPRQGVILVGGLPQRPEPPLDYSVVFSFETVIDEYTVPPRVIRDGQVMTLKPLSGLENVEFPPPVGPCECFLTDGLTTLLDTMPGRGLTTVEEKTVRYPGHRDRVGLLLDLGLLGEEPVRVGGIDVTPREVTAEVVTRCLKRADDQDLTCMRVTVTGDREVTFEMLDFFDQKSGVTSMARTTGYMCSIITQMVGNGDIGRRGFIPPEEAVTMENYPALERELQSRGILVTRTIV